MKKYKKPSHYEYDIVVIGAGSAGLVSAYIGAAGQAKVALIEKHKMGGDCLNTGCIPSKALIRTAKALDDIRRAADFGLRSAQADFEFSEVMERVQKVIAKIEPHDSVERYESLGVECLKGEAMILSPYEVRVGARTLTTRNIIIATGARPNVPEIPGLDTIAYFTSDTIWSLREKPRKLVVLGGGPIGMELAQAFRRLDIDTTLIERGARLLPKEDEDAAALVKSRFERDGLRVLLSHEVIRIEAGPTENEKYLICRTEDASETRIPCDTLLLALGRRANSAGFGLEALGIGTTAQGTIETDQSLRTKYPNIFACGDVAGPFQFTHAASHQAWHAAINALARPFKHFKVDYSVIPWCTYTDPEVARVGLNEQEARAKGIAYMVSRFSFEGLDRALCDGEAHGFVKVLTPPDSDKILGVTLVAHRAGELITEFVLAMKHELGLKQILSTIHIYPTLTEANKSAAGVWRRQTAPQGLLTWLKRIHAFRRKAPPRLKSK